MFPFFPLGVVDMGNATGNKSSLDYSSSELLHQMYLKQQGRKKNDLTKRLLEHSIITNVLKSTYLGS